MIADILRPIGVRVYTDARIRAQKMAIAGIMSAPRDRAGDQDERYRVAMTQSRCRRLVSDEAGTEEYGRSRIAT